jgi:hypothetical protein
LTKSLREVTTTSAPDRRTASSSSATEIAAWSRRSSTAGHAPVARATIA